jgi:hypothetical protein
LVSGRETGLGMSSGVGVFDLSESGVSDLSEGCVFGLSDCTDSMTDPALDVLGVAPLSKPSSSIAAFMARRTIDEVSDASEPTKPAGSSGRALDDTTELGGRSERADGRRAGYVLIVPVTDVPDDLVLSLLELTLLAFELASFDSFDSGLGRAVPTEELASVCAGGVGSWTETLGVVE